MATLESGFEDELKEALLDTAEEEAEGIGQELKDTAEQNFREYASRNDYSVEHIWQDAEGPTVERDGRSVRIGVEWPELTLLFCYGVEPHTISGDLAFPWASPPEGTRPQGAPSFVVADEVNWGSVTGGIPESRAIRNALAEIRRELRG